MNLGKGMHSEMEPISEKWLWREARLKDTDGNQLIRFHGGKNKPNPAWKIQNN